jgi:hypothetical protein
MPYTGPDWQPILRKALPQATERAINHYTVALREFWTYGDDRLTERLRRIANGGDIEAELISLDIDVGIVRRGMFVFHPRLEELYAALTLEEFPGREHEAELVAETIGAWWPASAEGLKELAEAIVKARRALPALQYRLDLPSRLSHQSDAEVRADMRHRLDAVLEQVTFLRAALDDE